MALSSLASTPACSSEVRHFFGTSARKFSSLLRLPGRVSLRGRYRTHRALLRQDHETTLPKRGRTAIRQVRIDQRQRPQLQHPLRPAQAPRVRSLSPFNDIHSQLIILHALQDGRRAVLRALHRLHHQGRARPETDGTQTYLRERLSYACSQIPVALLTEGWHGARRARRRLRRERLHVQQSARCAGACGPEHPAPGESCVRFSLSCFFFLSLALAHRKFSSTFIFDFWVVCLANKQKQGGVRRCDLLLPRPLRAHAGVEDHVRQLLPHPVQPQRAGPPRADIEDVHLGVRP
jgi:hypothetical protein